MNSETKYLILAVLLTALAFSNTLLNDFVNWDDPANFLEHPAIASDAGLWESLRIIFTTDVIGNYNPLSTASFLIDRGVFGFDQPWGWHLINGLLHLANLVVLFFICKRLGLTAWGGFITIVLFGIHPMRVESVAWVTERKDVLFTLFYLLAILQYLKYSEGAKKNHYGWLLFFFILALFSKIQAVALPLSLLALDYLKSGAWKLRNWTSKWPLFIFSLLVGLLGVYILISGQSISAERVDTVLGKNIVLAGYAVLTYLYKLILPLNLSPYYQYPDALMWYHYLGIPTLLFLLFALYKSYRWQNRWYFFGLFFFSVNIFFVLQWVNAGQGYLADRFTYVPYIGLFMITAQWAEQRMLKWSGTMRWAIFGAVCMLLSIQTIRQNSVWQNGETLWTKAADVNPESFRPLANRGNFRARKGEIQEAIQDYTEALKYTSLDEVYRNRAKLWIAHSTSETELQNAASDLEGLKQKKAEDFVNMGAAYMKLRQGEKALISYSNGLVAFPDHLDLLLNRGRVHQALGKYEAALRDFDSVLRFNQNRSDAWFEKGRLLRNLGRSAEAFESLNQAINRDPSMCLAFYERSIVYAQGGQMEAARSDLKKAVEMECPGIDVNYRAQLGI